MNLRNAVLEHDREADRDREIGVGHRDLHPRGELLSDPQGQLESFDRHDEAENAQGHVDQKGDDSPPSDGKPLHQGVDAEMGAALQGQRGTQKSHPDKEIPGQLLRPVEGIVEELNAWTWYWEQQGRQAQAIYALQVSLRLRPGQPEVARRLADLESRRTPKHNE